MYVRSESRATEDIDPEATRTVDGAVTGTAAYMPPEQAQGRTADVPSDIFSFGAVSRELLSGRRAFTGDSVLETLNAVVRSEPAPLDSPRSAVVKKCLATSASGRCGPD